MFLFEAKGKKGREEIVFTEPHVIEGAGAKAFKPAKQAPKAVEPKAPAVAETPARAAKPVLAQKPTRVVTPDAAQATFAATQAASPQQLFNERWLAQLRTQIDETREMIRTYPLRNGTITDAHNLSKRMNELDAAIASVESRAKTTDPRQLAGIIKREVRDPFHAEYAKVEKLLGLGKPARGQQLAVR